MITNGTKLTASIFERLSRLPLAISVSLDTLNRETYQQIRGADQLAQVLEGIALLNAFPHPKFLTCIVSNVNRAEVSAVVRFAREQGFLPVVGAYHWNVGTYGISPGRSTTARASSTGNLTLLWGVNGALGIAS